MSRIDKHFNRNPIELFSSELERKLQTLGTRTGEVVSVPYRIPKQTVKIVTQPVAQQPVTYDDEDETTFDWLTDEETKMFLSRHFIASQSISLAYFVDRALNEFKFSLDKRQLLEFQKRVQSLLTTVNSEEISLNALDLATKKRPLSTLLRDIINQLKLYTVEEALHTKYKSKTTQLELAQQQIAQLADQLQDKQNDLIAQETALLEAQNKLKERARHEKERKTSLDEKQKRLIQKEQQLKSLLTDFSRKLTEEGIAKVAKYMKSAQNRITQHEKNMNFRMEALKSKMAKIQAIVQIPTESKATLSENNYKHLLKKCEKELQRLKEEALQQQTRKQEEEKGLLKAYAVIERKLASTVNRNRALTDQITRKDQAISAYLKSESKSPSKKSSQITAPSEKQQGSSKASEELINWLSSLMIRREQPDIIELLEHSSRCGKGNRLPSGFACLFTRAMMLQSKQLHNSSQVSIFLADAIKVLPPIAFGTMPGLAGFYIGLYCFMRDDCQKSLTSSIECLEEATSQELSQLIEAGALMLLLSLTRMRENKSSLIIDLVLSLWEGCTPQHQQSRFLQELVTKDHIDSVVSLGAQGDLQSLEKASIILQRCSHYLGNQFRLTTQSECVINRLAYSPSINQYPMLKANLKSILDAQANKNTQKKL